MDQESRHPLSTYLQADGSVTRMCHFQAAHVYQGQGRLLIPLISPMSASEYALPRKGEPGSRIQLCSHKASGVLQTNASLLPGHPMRTIPPFQPHVALTHRLHGTGSTMLPCAASCTPLHSQRQVLSTRVCSLRHMPITIFKYGTCWLTTQLLAGTARAALLSSPEAPLAFIKTHSSLSLEVQIIQQ